MPHNQMTLSRFFEQLDRSFESLFSEEPPFTLILGAGASRSAGIPIAHKMNQCLRMIVEARGYPLDYRFDGESDLSLLIRTIAEFSDDSEVRGFILRCIRRGSREPNITHLIAANLACANVFKTIITTNFDDLALAAFWNLPVNEAYSEPFVMYDPRAVKYSKIELGDEVPVIIKAHGHHTHYGMGILDYQIRELVPSVKRAIRWCVNPSLGYLVVGYSGAWDDGVMAALKDPRLARGKTIYWFFRGRQPVLHQPLQELVATQDVRFIRCDDSDYLFLCLLSFFKMEAFMGSGWLLDASELFTAPGMNELFANRIMPARTSWWPGTREPKDAKAQERRLQQLRKMTNVELRRDLGIPKLRKQFLPILNKIDDWDEGVLLSYDCVSPDVRRHVDPVGLIASFGREPPEVSQLRMMIGTRIPWTRRNLKLFRLAMNVHVDPFILHDLLSAIDRMAKL
jgi:hypothetical protein